MRSALKLVQVRLRIPMVLVFAALVVGRWDVIRNYWDKLHGSHRAESIASHPVSTDTEYFCPDGPRRGLGLAGPMRGLQHGAGASQEG